MTPGWLREVVDDLTASEGDQMISVQDWERFRDIRRRAEGGGELSDRECEELERMWKRLA